MPNDQQQQLIIEKLKDSCQIPLDCGKTINEVLDKIDTANDLTEQQQQQITKTLKEYCQEPQNCEKTIKEVIDKIAAAKDIKDLFAPEVIKHKHIEEITGYFIPVQDDPKTIPCSSKSKMPATDQEYEESLGCYPMTDYNLCHRGNIYFPTIKDLCMENKQLKPTFGIALAVLYTLKKLDAQNVIFRKTALSPSF